MKKTIAFLVFLMMAATICAQKGKTSVGVNVGYGHSNSWNAAKLGAEVNINVARAICLTPSFEYFFYGSGRDTWNVNLDGAYLIPVTDRLDFFPIVGVAFLHCADNYIGANIGAGFKYACTTRIDLNIKAKYQIVKDIDQFTLGAGVAYKF